MRRAVTAGAPPTRPYKLPRSVLVVVYTPAGEVLLLHRSDAPDHWQSVTGSQDFADEPAVETAAREVFEETGIDCRAGTPLADALQDWGIENTYTIYPQWLHRYAPGVLHNTERVFGLCVPAGTPVVLSPREHVDFAWWSWREAADRCFSPSNAEAILLLTRFAALAA